MKILITGGLGHIGSYLIRRLPEIVSVGEIIVVDSMLTQRFNSLFYLQNNTKFKFIEGDIRDSQILSELNDLDIKIIIHLAAITDPSYSFKYPQDLFENNLLGTKKIIEFGLINSIPIIFPSTTSLYSDYDELQDENFAILDPQSPYAECKILEEVEMRNAFSIGLSGIILRLGTIHGVSPGMRFHTAVNKFCYQAAFGLPVPVWTTALKQKRPYLSLYDLSRALVHIFENELYSGEIYNIISKNFSVENILHKIEECTKEGLNINFVDSEIMNSYSYTVSNKKFMETGFEFSDRISIDINDTLRMLSRI